MAHRIFLIIIIAATSWLFFALKAYAVNFSDINDETPYSKAIFYLSDKSVIQGYPDGSFHADNLLNRAELLAMVVRSQYKDDEYSSYNSCFDDVKNEWFAGPVCFSKQRGWVAGYQDGLFHPEQMVNKVEALKIIFRVFQLPTDLEQPQFYFYDVPLTSWFADEVSYARGYSFVDEHDERFSPESPLTRAYFSEIMYRILVQEFVKLPNFYDPSETIAIFAGDDMYGKFTAEIELFVEDIKKLNNVKTVFSHGVLQTPEKIRFRLQDLYRNEGLKGAIFIGDIPSVSFGAEGETNIVSDWYYQDLDNTLMEENNNDSIISRRSYSSLNPITDREIWTSRIKPPISGSEGDDLIKRYFNKYHRYANGELIYEKKMFIFDSVAINQLNQGQSVLKNSVGLIGENLLYNNRSKIDVLFHDTIKDQRTMYLKRLGTPYELNVITIHGGMFSQWLGEDVIVSTSDVQSNPPQGLYYKINVASNGDFAQDNYLAGWYLFSGNALTVSAQSAASPSLNSSNTCADATIPALNYGIAIGDSFRNETEFLVPQLFGDGSLRIRTRNVEIVENSPRLLVKRLSIDFGNILIEEDQILPLFFKNEGKQKLFMCIAPLSSILDSQPIEFQKQPFYVYSNEDYLSSKRPSFLEIQPGEILQLPIAFDPSNVGLAGVYEGRMIVYTNDPHQPFMRLFFRGRAN